MKRLTSLIMGMAVLAVAVPSFAGVREERAIDQGIRSGALTAREAAFLMRREAALRAEIHRLRMFHGGRLTWRERRRIARQRAELDRVIFRLKHNRFYR